MYTQRQAEKSREKGGRRSKRGSETERERERENVIGRWSSRERKRRREGHARVRRERRTTWRREEGAEQRLLSMQDACASAPPPGVVRAQARAHSYTSCVRVYIRTARLSIYRSITADGRGEFGGHAEGFACVSMTREEAFDALSLNYDTRRPRSGVPGRGGGRALDPRTLSSR